MFVFPAGKKRKKDESGINGKRDVNKVRSRYCGPFFNIFNPFTGFRLVQKQQRVFSAPLFLHGSQFTLHPRLNQKVCPTPPTCPPSRGPDSNQSWHPVFLLRAVQVQKRFVHHFKSCNPLGFHKQPGSGGCLSLYLSLYRSEAMKCCTAVHGPQWVKYTDSGRRLALPS